MDPSAEHFNQDYFTGLYGALPAQTWADRSRDVLIARMVTRHDHYRTSCGLDTSAAAPGGHSPASGPPAPLLDMGCGYGYLLERFRSHYRLYGADISSHAVEVASSRLPEATVVVGNAEEAFPFSIFFGVILLVNVLEHLASPSVAVRRLHDALLPGGICVVHLPTINNAFNRLYYRFSYAKDESHVFRPSGRQVTKLFEAEGFALLEESYAPHSPASVWRALKPFPPYLAAYRKVR